MDKSLKLHLEPRTSSILIRVNNFLTKHRIKSYLVGGFVRDVLLGRETADIDIAVAADALEIAPKIATALGGKYVLLDEVNGVGRVVVFGEGGRWELDFSTVRGGIEQDLERRDFTIDAMAVDFSQLGDDFRLIDPFGGYNDFCQGVIRMVSETAFQSDAVRLLRAVRLAAELGFSIDILTESIIRRDCQLLAIVSGERVREELLRLLAVPQTGHFLAYLDELNLLTVMMPQLAQIRGVVQPNEHFWDVFYHSIKTVVATSFLLRQGNWEEVSDNVLAVTLWSEALARHFELKVSQGSTRGSMLKLAALLHDIAKPQTRTIEADGRMRFLGHAKEGADMAVNILKRLRFSSKEVDLVETIVRHHLRPTQMSGDRLPTHRAIYRYFRDTGEAGIDILFLSLADHLATRGANLEVDEWREHAKLVEYILSHRFQEESVVMLPKLVDGHTLISTFGLSPGPRIRELLEVVREAQAGGELTTRAEALAFVRKQLATGAMR